MDNQAFSLNNTIEKLNSNVLQMLSERGKNIFFPKLGFLSQSAQAKGKAINATIGEAVEDDGTSMHLPEFDALVNMPMVSGATLTKLLGTSAWYAPGAAVAAIVEAIVRDEKKVFPCCVALEGEYGQSDICIGVPVVIGRNGIENIVDYKLNAEEQAVFNKSADAVRSMNGVLKELSIL